MRTLESKLNEEVRQLDEIVRSTRERLERAPKGRLRITKKRKGVEYYYKEEQAGVSKEAGNSKRYNNGKYLKKSEKELAKAIAQRDYDAQILKNAEERIKIIEAFLANYKKTSLKKIYQNTSLYRRELIKPIIVTNEEYVKRWLAVEYKGKEFAEDAPEIFTERGERVRSKSEKIIADKLYSLRIPYRYECPVTLEGNIRVYPDFTILRMPEREEVYLEHLGMMDDVDYVRMAMHKLSTYERNGMLLGVNLFITYETDKLPLNTRSLDFLLRKLFCKI